MKEKILSISEVYKKNECTNTNYEGYEIKTDKQSILIIIESGQFCCEDSGYMVSEDDLRDFLGAEINSISVTDTTHNTRVIEKFVDMDYQVHKYNDGETSVDMACGGIEFVNISTSNGELQFAVYNFHNGYYGHDILIKFNDTTITKLI